MTNGVLKREPRHFASSSFIIGIIIALFCSNRERNERDEKERNSTLSEIAISLSFSPLLFSLWLLFLWHKKTTQIVRKARTLATVRFLNWLETAENCVSWVVCCDEKKLFRTSVSRLLSSRWLRETRLIFATRVKGLIPTWVANLPATERKKSISARARINERELCEIHLARLL